MSDCKAEPTVAGTDLPTKVWTFARESCVKVAKSAEEVAETATKLQNIFKRSAPREGHEQAMEAFTRACEDQDRVYRLIRNGFMSHKLSWPNRDYTLTSDQEEEADKEPYETLRSHPRELTDAGPRSTIQKKASTCFWK